MVVKPIRVIFSYVLSLYIAVWLLLCVFYGQLYGFQMPLWADWEGGLQEKSRWIWQYLLDDNNFTLVNMEGLSVAERRHLLDVKRILQAIEQLCYIGIIVTGCSVAIGWFVLKKSFCGLFQQIAISLFSLIVFLGILAIVNFFDYFLLLHEILFEKDTWFFSGDSLLIRLFPFQYFQQFLFFLLLFSLLLVFLFFVFYSRCKRPFI